MIKILAVAGALLLLASCGGKKPGRPAVDSGAIWDSLYRVDSLRAEDSLARLDSLRDALETARFDSLRMADSLRRAQAEAQSVEPPRSPHFAEIATLLGEYDKLSMDLENFISADGKFHPGAGSVMETFYRPAMERYRRLVHLKGEMTPGQKAHFEKINRRIRPVLENK